MAKKDYFAVLGLEDDASLAEIKQQYRKLAKKWHPDISKEKEAEKRFEEIKEAYDAVIEERKKNPNPPKRKKFTFKATEPATEFKPDSDYDNLSFSEFSTEGDSKHINPVYDALFKEFSTKQTGLRKSTKVLIFVLMIWLIFFIALNIQNIMYMGTSIWDLFTNKIFLEFLFYFIFLGYVLRSAYKKSRRYF